MPIGKHEDLDRLLKEGYKRIGGALQQKKLAPMVKSKSIGGRTIKYSRGGNLNPLDHNQPFDEEAVVYVWHEKLQKYLKFSSGHAAMKLTRRKDGQRDVLAYLSWWPLEESHWGKLVVFAPAQDGECKASTKKDREGEMGGDEEMNTILKLKVIKAGCTREEFEVVANYLWNQLTPDQQKRCTRVCGNKFSKLDDTKYSVRPTQKMIYMGKEKGDRYHGVSNLASLVKDGMIDWVKDLQVVKQPYAKIYVPGACPPAAVHQFDSYQDRSPWGLSLDAIRWKSLSYNVGMHDYKMMSWTNNCIGAVWECLKSGLAEVLSPRFKPKRGKVQDLVHKCSLLPSDAIEASVALSTDILLLNKQQQFLDLKAWEHQKKISMLAHQQKLLGFGWRSCFSDLELWQVLSNDKTKFRFQRPKKMRTIDEQLKLVVKKECALGQRDEANLLLRLEAEWESRGQDVRLIKKDLGKIAKVRERLEEENLSQNQVLKAKAQIKKLSDEIARAKKDCKPTLEAWEALLDQHEKVRRARAELLVKLHDAIFDFVSTHKSVDRHYLAAVLLGQLVCWRFSEVARDNLAVWLEDDLDGLSPLLEEKNRKLGDAFDWHRVVKTAKRRKATATETFP